MEDRERERLRKKERLRNSGKQVHPAKKNVRSKIPLVEGTVTEQLPEFFARSPEFRKLFITIRACLGIKKLSFSLITKRAEQIQIGQEEVSGDEGLVFLAPGEAGNDVTIKMAKNTKFEILEASPATNEILLVFRWGEETWFYTRFCKEDGRIYLQPARYLQKHKQIKSLIEFRSRTIANVFVNEHFHEFKWINGCFVKRVKDVETIKALEERTDHRYEHDACSLYVHRRNYRFFVREGIKWFEKYPDHREYYNYYHFFLDVEGKIPEK